MAKRTLNYLNPQAWLPIGQHVELPNERGFYVPWTHDADGNRVYHKAGVIAEHLSGGHVAVKFDGYPHTVD